MLGATIGDANCDPSANPRKAIVIQQVDNKFYCVVADTEVQAWEIGQRLRGHVPTQVEIAEAKAALGD